MAPAAAVMAEALAAMPLKAPAVPLVANVTASAVNTPDGIRHLLVEQVTAMVRWNESVLYMKERGVTQIVELGAGKVLTGLTRRIDRDLEALSIGTAAEIDAFLAKV